MYFQNIKYPVIINSESLSSQYQNASAYYVSTLSKIYLVYVNECCICMCQKKASDSIIDDCEPPCCGCCELSPGPLEEQQVLLTHLQSGCVLKDSAFLPLGGRLSRETTEPGKQSSGSGIRPLFYMYSKAVNSKPTLLPQITNKNYTETSFLEITASKAFYTNLQFIRKCKIKTSVE